MGLLAGGALSKAAISSGLGHREVSGQLNKVSRLLLLEMCVEYTLPDKPNRRLQKYVLTEPGARRLGALRTGEGWTVSAISRTERVTHDRVIAQFIDPARPDNLGYCVFRCSRPPIPIEFGHPYDGDRPPVRRCSAARMEVIDHRFEAGRRRAFDARQFRAGTSSTAGPDTRVVLRSASVRAAPSASIDAATGCGPDRSAARIVTAGRWIP